MFLPLHDSHSPMLVSRWALNASMVGCSACQRRTIWPNSWDNSLENGLLHSISVPQPPTLPRFVSQLYEIEYQRLRTLHTSQPATNAFGVRTGLCPRPWTQRTGWPKLFQGVPQDVLVKLTQIPTRATEKTGLVLGVIIGQKLSSPAYRIILRWYGDQTTYKPVPKMCM